MKKIGLFIGLLLLTAATSVMAQDGLNNKRISLIAKSVVQILALDANGQPFSSGSGTIVDAGGLIYTNRHVVEGGTDYAIYLTDDMSETPTHQYYATIVGVSPFIDFAVLQIDRDKFGRPVDADRLELPYIGNATSDITHGDHLYIFGYPGIGEGYIVLTQGNVTTIENGSVGDERMPLWLQTDAEISPGNSGGLVVNNNGEFVGIPTAVRSETNTGGRLGGILPYTAIDTVLNMDDGLVALSDLPDSGTTTVSTSDLVGGISVDCGNLGSFDNGVEVTVIQMRAGFQYTATAIGINGFDPILAVLDTSTGEGTCVDNQPDASYYTVDLPSTGNVPGSNSTAQVLFSQNTGQNMADQSLVVGGVNNMPGEFVLILEGMAVTGADGAGDPFEVRVTPGMVGTGVPLTVYQVSKVTNLDTYISMAYVGDNGNWNYYLDDNDNQIFYCDDAGNSDLCWGASADMSNSSVAQKGQRLLPGGPLDSMIQLPLDSFTDFAEGDYFFDFLMSSSQNTSGDYTVVIHAGTQ